MKIIDNIRKKLGFNEERVIYNNDKLSEVLESDRILQQKIMELIHKLNSIKK